MLTARRRRRHGYGKVQRILAGALVALLSGGAAMAAEPAPIRLELNRLEPVEQGCRVYLVVGNEGTDPLQSLKLDLVLFRSDGVIDRRLALETGPLRAAKTSVKLFDLTDLPCDGLGSILVNDVLSCGASGDAGSDCFPRLALATRTPAGFTK